MVACMYSKKQFDMKYDKRIGNNTQRIACSNKNDDIFILLQNQQMFIYIYLDLKNQSYKYCTVKKNIQ